jgi:hypothetical protein
MCDSDQRISKQGVGSEQTFFAQIGEKVGPAVRQEKKKKKKKEKKEET